MQQISTDNLYHHTKLEALKSILKSRGFWYTQKIETVPYIRQSFKQENFVVCFCDLPIRDSNHVRHRFRSVSIGLNKEWGIRKQVSPVTYIHAGSPGLDDGYMALKNVFRADEIAIRHNFDFDRTRIQLIQGATLRLYSDMFGNGDPMVLGQFTLDHSLLEGYAEELNTIAENISSEEARIARHTFEALMWCIRLLHNHLETRDSFFRKHEEILETGETVRLYDEREWRAAFQFGMDTESQIDRTGIIPRLKNEHNLTFEDSDIAEIVVRTQNDQIDVETFLKEIGRSEIISKIVIMPFD